MSPAELAQLVRTRREQLHLTQNELARRVGVSRSEISEIEAGRVRHPRAAVFARLGKVLALPAAALFAAVGYAAGDVLGGPEFAELEDAPEELLLLGSLVAQMTRTERAWLRERLRELQQLVLMRRGAGPRRRGGRGRATRRGRQTT